MNVASRELCEELYKISQWEERTSFYWQYTKPAGDWMITPQTQTGTLKHYPAYDFDYLLRMLPLASGKGGLLFLQVTNNGRWSCGHRGGYSRLADTPANAAAKLAIELFKQGILPKGERGE